MSRNYFFARNCNISAIFPAKKRSDIKRRGVPSTWIFPEFSILFLSVFTSHQLKGLRESNLSYFHFHVCFHSGFNDLLLRRFFTWIFLEFSMPFLSSLTLHLLNRVRSKRIKIIMRFSFRLYWRRWSAPCNWIFLDFSMLFRSAVPFNQLKGFRS